VGAPADYIALTKPRIVALVMLTVAAGFVVALPAAARVGFAGNAGTSPLAVQLWILVNALVGTALVAGGTNALNQIAERDVDALMRRTQGRPLPAGRLEPNAARWFAWTIAALGVAQLALLVNLTTALLAALTLISYVFAYTPLKRRTSRLWTRMRACCSPSSFSGRCRTSSPSAGCIARTTPARACAC